MARPGNEDGGGSPGNAPASLFLKEGVDIASAAALAPPGGGYFNVTGTTTITSLPTFAVGTVVVLEFDGALTLTYNATTLILQGSANLATAAGDIVALRSEGGGNWRELWRRLAAAAAAGAVTRQGGSTTEATTTSTTAGDVLTASTLSVAAAEAFWFLYSARKTTGAAADVGCGTKLNTTLTSEAIATDSNKGWATDAGLNRAEEGHSWWRVSARVTNYLAGIAGHYIRKQSATGVGAGGANQQHGTESALMPTAQITDVIIRGITGNASVTLGIDELQVYSLAAS